MAIYNVPIVYKGQKNYIVDASSPEEAEELARELWSNCEEPTQLGNEWEKIDTFGPIELVKEG